MAQMAQQRLSNEHIQSFCKNSHLGAQAVQAQAPYPGAYVEADVCIAGSGPIGCGFARHIIDNSPYTVFMADMGAQTSPKVGAHEKNEIKYQKDIDAFVNVIKGALQTVSIPPGDTNIPTLQGQGWTPSVNKPLTIYGHNPNQIPEHNLGATAQTRAVGGMATHWTCATPFPHADERKNNPIPASELDSLLHKARECLNVHDDQYDHSIRHTVVKETLQAKYPNRGIRSLPLAVERRKDNPTYVTWSGSNTVLGDAVNSERFTLSPETRATRIIFDNNGECLGMLMRDLQTDRDRFVRARAVVVACGAIGTPQLLYNSEIRPRPLGRYLTEQSMTFCQIVMKADMIENISKDPRFRERVQAHQKAYPNDPLPIPFTDPEPQVNVPYSSEFPYHVQVHRDAFSYGDVGPKADPRLVVDLRFFGKQDISENNMVYFGPSAGETMRSGWTPGLTDSYGMPQATFEVRRSRDDNSRDQEMMREMCDFANTLGSYLPGSNPQYMTPGLALHITGTTRIGKDERSSVADENSRVHHFKNLWVGGNGCIPDSTACNPTLTSLAIALKAANSIVNHLNERKH